MLLRNKALLSTCFHAGFLLGLWRWRRYVPPKRRLTFNGLYGVISQKRAALSYEYLYILRMGKVASFTCRVTLQHFTQLDYTKRLQLFRSSNSCRTRMCWVRGGSRPRTWASGACLANNRILYRRDVTLR
jgi:hypothetical protein